MASQVPGSGTVQPVGGDSVSLMLSVAQGPRSSLTPSLCWCLTALLRTPLLHPHTAAGLSPISTQPRLPALQGSLIFLAALGRPRWLPLMPVCCPTLDRLGEAGRLLITKLPLVTRSTFQGQQEGCGGSGGSVTPSVPWEDSQLTRELQAGAVLKVLERA